MATLYDLTLTGLTMDEAVVLVESLSVYASDIADINPEHAQAATGLAKRVDAQLTAREIAGND